MSWLVDTNVLVRICDVSSKDRLIAAEAFDRLLDQRNFYSCAQSLIEFWVVATRPLEANGLGFTAQHGIAKLEEFRSLVPCLPEPTDIFDTWKSLIAKHSVTGRKAYDARLVAIMVAHRIENILTFNLADFSKFQNIRAISPSQFLASGS